MVLDYLPTFSPYFWPSFVGEHIPDIPTHNGPTFHDLPTFQIFSCIKYNGIIYLDWKIICTSQIMSCIKYCFFFPTFQIFFHYLSHFKSGIGRRTLGLGSVSGTEDVARDFGVGISEARHPSVHTMAMRWGEDQERLTGADG